MAGIDVEELQSWARESGALARSYFNRVVALRKPDRSWVTQADIEIEKLLVERITKRYPEHGIIGEEQTRHNLEREFVWALDPIDGTAAFVTGLPIWGVSLGLLQHGKPYFGMFYMPITDELYWAAPGEPAFLNGSPIEVIGPREWDNEDWISIPSNAHRRFTVDFIGKTRSLGSIVADICYVARGSSLGAVSTRSSIWDLAGGLAILYAAGGVIVGLSGQQPDIAAMVNGTPLREPIVAAGPTHLEALRSRVSERRKQ